MLCVWMYDPLAVNYDAAATADDGCIQYACTAAPYAENFDAGLGTWTQFANDDFDWSLDLLLHHLELAHRLVT